MKNLLIYVSPTGSLDNPDPHSTNDAEILTKIQIENSLEMGWKPDDLILVTNFEYKYNQIKSLVFKDIKYYELFPKASKINAICKLFEKDLIQKDELYWFHDLDAFQAVSIDSLIPNMDSFDLALASYKGYDLSPQFIEKKRWNTGSFFFKHEAGDIFDQIKLVMYDNKIHEERALTKLTNDNLLISKRVKELNPTYNFVVNLKYKNKKEIIRPIKVAHFHPFGAIPKHDPDCPFLSENLEKIFRSHNIS